MSFSRYKHLLWRTNCRQFLSWVILCALRAFPVLVTAKHPLSFWDSRLSNTWRAMLPNTRIWLSVSTTRKLGSTRIRSGVAVPWRANNENLYLEKDVIWRRSQNDYIYKAWNEVIMKCIAKIVSLFCIKVVGGTTNEEHWGRAGKMYYCRTQMIQSALRDAFVCSPIHLHLLLIIFRKKAALYQLVLDLNAPCFNQSSYWIHPAIQSPRTSSLQKRCRYTSIVYPSPRGSWRVEAPQSAPYWAVRDVSLYVRQVGRTQHS